MSTRYFKAESRSEWGREGEPTIEDLRLGTEMRIADVAEWFKGWAGSFRGCRLVTAVEKIAKGRVVITHRFELRITIRWPWAKRKGGKKR